jgi:hypothetical protein|tara:strand:+ start:183 stop:497 length:315 start_codon:yes stop_codon:yes gene_type:complete
MFVELDENGVVIRGILATQEYIDSGAVGEKDNWRETNKKAGIGWVYDENIGDVIPPKLFNSWIFNESTYTWEPPVPIPGVGETPIVPYSWDEDTVSWKEIEVDD